MTYDFKLWEEAAWAALVAAAIQLLMVLVGFDPAAVTDWRSWAIALGAGLVRAAAGAAIAVVTAPKGGA